MDMAASNVLVGVKPFRGWIGRTWGEPLARFMPPGSPGTWQAGCVLVARGGAGWRDRLRFMVA